MDTIRRKVEEYIKLGGNPKFIHDLDEIDDCIEKVKYLKSKNALHRQQEFEYQELYWVQQDIESEEKSDKEIALLLNAEGNDLTSVVKQGDYLFVQYNDINDPADTIRIDTAKSYNEYTVQFLEYRTVSLKFNKNCYYVYDYDEQKQLYYKTTVGANQKIEVSAMPIPAVSGWSMLVINGLELLCPTEEAEKVMLLYTQRNLSIIEEENTLSALATENINNLSGVEFERVCQRLVENMGFETETTKASGDGGIDLVAYNHQLLLSGKYIIQCKRYSGSFGEPIIRDLYGVVMSERANKGILMTTGYFTKSAITFADGKPIELIDGKEMQVLLSNNGISVGKSNTFYSKLLSTIGINDFENICMQFICNQNYHIKNIVERSDEYILIEADDKDNSKKLLFVCCQEREYINEQRWNGIMQKVCIAEFDKLIAIGTSEFDKDCMLNADENKIEVIGFEKFLNMLRKQGIVDDEGINLKIGMVSPDKEAILDDVYGFMKSNYISNVNDVEAQLAFMEVLNETIFGAWHENKSDEVLDKLIREYFMVEEKFEGINENIQYMLLYVRTNILWCKGKIDEIVRAYKKLLEWDILVNSLEYENGLEDIYLGVVYNLYQLLLIKNCVQEGKEIYQKHNRIIEYGLDYYKGEIEYGKATGDIEYAQQWQHVYDIISNGEIGEIFVLCNLDNYVISEIHRSIGYKSMILGCFGNVDDTKSAESIGLNILVDLIDFEQREDGFYVRKKEGMERIQLI